MDAEERETRRDKLIKSAKQSLIKGDTSRAIAEAKQSLKYGESPVAYRLLGIAYEKRGETARAIKYYNLALKADCDSEMAEKLRKKIKQLGGAPAC